MIPFLGLAAVAITIAVGLLLNHGGTVLGTKLPPFVMTYRPDLHPDVVIAILVLVAAALVVPRVIDRRWRAPVVAVALYGLALALGLAVNMARNGVHDWWWCSPPARGSRRALRVPDRTPDAGPRDPLLPSHFAAVPVLTAHAKGNPPGPLVAAPARGPPRRAIRRAVPRGRRIAPPLAYDLGRCSGTSIAGVSRPADRLRAGGHALRRHLGRLRVRRLGMVVACLFVTPADGGLGVGAGGSRRLGDVLLVAAVAIPAWSVFSRSARRLAGRRVRSPPHRGDRVRPLLRSRRLRPVQRAQRDPRANTPAWRRAGRTRSGCSARRRPGRRCSGYRCCGCLGAREPSRAPWRSRR